MKKKFAAIMLVVSLLVGFIPATPLLAAETTLQDGENLREAVERASPGDTIILAGGGHVHDVENDSSPWIIDKEITIRGGTLHLNSGGIILGANVTFQNVKLSFKNRIRNVIMANGYTLTLENVSWDTSTNNNNVHLACGGLTGYTGAYTLPNAGSHGKVIVRGSTSLGNVYAGSIASGEGADNVFSSPAEIIIESGASGKMGEVYSCGALEAHADENEILNPDYVVAPPQAASSKYRVSGEVAISLYDTVVTSVDGATGANTNAKISYTGGVYLNSTLKFTNIAGLTMVSGTLQPAAGSSFVPGAELTVSDGTQLDMGNLTAQEMGNFTGGGTLVLGEKQTLGINGTVSGSPTKVGIGSVFGEYSQKVPETDHTYIAAPKSGNDSFALIPHSGNPNMILRNDGSGNWYVANPGTEIVVQSIRIQDQQVSKEETISGVILPLNVTYAANSAAVAYVDWIPLEISVNNIPAVRSEDQYGGYSFACSLLDNAAGTLFVLEDSLYLYNTADDAAIPAGTYVIEITVPGKYMSDGRDYPFSVTLTVTDGSVPQIVAVTDITGVPSAAVAGVDLPLTGTVSPAEATNKTIVWSVKDAGTTGAKISNHTLSTTAAGTAIVTATVANGKGVGSDYTKDFTISVKESGKTLVSDKIELTVSDVAYGTLPSPIGSFIKTTEGVQETGWTYLYSTNAGADYHTLDTLLNPSGYLPAGEYRVKASYEDEVKYGEQTAAFWVNKKELTVSMDVTGVTKVYDGTTAVVGTQPRLTLSGAVGAEVPVLSDGVTYAYSDANVGINKTVTASGLSLDSSVEVNKNYHLAATQITQAGAAITEGSSPGEEIIIPPPASASLKFAQGEYTNYVKHKVDFSKELLKGETEVKNETLTWSVSNRAYAVVNQQGVVTMKKATGEAQVILTAATPDGVLAQTRLRIEAANPAARLTLRQGEQAIKKLTLADVGSTAQLTVTVDQAKDPSKPHTETFTWTSSRPDIVAVNTDPVEGTKAALTATGVGKARITVQAASGRKATLTVTANALLKRLTLVDEKGNEELSVAPGKKLILKAIRDPQVNTDKLYWSSSDQSLVTVNARGVVTIKAKAVPQPTEVILTASTRYSAKSGKTNVSDDFVLTIQPSRIRGLENILGDENIMVGDVRTYTAHLLGEGSPGEITWTSSNPRVLSIDEEGKARALKKGSATLKATVATVDEQGKGKMVTKALKVKVSQPTTDLTMKKEVITVMAGKTRTVAFSAVKAPKGAIGEIVYKVTGTSGSLTVEQVQVQKNRITIPATAKAGDTVTVQASVEGVTCEGKLLVVSGEGKSKVTTNNPGIHKGRIKVFQGAVFNLYARPTYTENETLTYSVNKAGIVSVDEQGNVYALHPGTAKVTAKTTSGAKVTITVTVEPKWVEED